MIALSARWASELASKAETGIGYQVVTIFLKDGRRYEQVVVIEGQSPRSEESRSFCFLKMRLLRSS